MKSNREIWVTGIGVVTPHGVTKESLWKSVVGGVPCEQGGLAEPINGAVYIDTKKFVSSGIYINKKKPYSDQRRGYVIESALRAIDDAGLNGRVDLGAVIACSRPTMGRSEKWLNAVKHLVAGDVTPDMNAPVAGSVEIPCLYLLKKMGFRGPSFGVTASCVSGLMAIICASRVIKFGDSDIMLAGAVEVVPETVFMASYKNMRVMTDKYENFRPCHSNRNGFFISEGSAVVVLETAESAISRGKQPYAVIDDWSVLSDPSGLTSMNPDGEVISKIISNLTNGGKDVPDYINLHGTATDINDIAEARALKNVFRNNAGKLSLSATKPQTGHMLGAVSAVEAVITVMSVYNDQIPPTIRLDNPDTECDLNYTPIKYVDKTVNSAISLSYGFNGPMAGILVKKHI